LDTRLAAQLGERHTLTVGGPYMDAEVEDGIAAERLERRSWAVFAEDEWRIIEPLGLTLRGRYENHDAFRGHFSPRAHLTWPASGGWTLKGGVSRGYRTPSVNELHDGINGATGQGSIITIGSPRLRPETSTNHEIGFYYDGPEGFNANLTLFHTEFKDMISSGTPVPNCWSAEAPNLPGCLDLGSGFTQDSFARNTNV